MFSVTISVVFGDSSRRDYFGKQREIHFTAERFTPPIFGRDFFLNSGTASLFYEKYIWKIGCAS